MPLTLNNIQEKYKSLLNDFGYLMLDDMKHKHNSYKIELNKFIEDGNAKLRELHNVDTILDLNIMLDHITQILNKFEYISTKTRRTSDYNKFIHNTYDTIQKDNPNMEYNDIMREIRTKWNSRKQQGGYDYIEYNDDENNDDENNDDENNDDENNDDENNDDENNDDENNDDDYKNNENEDNNSKIVYMEAIIEPFVGGNKEEKREIDINKWKQQIKNYLL
jgi:hypothetical protein